MKRIRAASGTSRAVARPQGVAVKTSVFAFESDRAHARVHAALCSAEAGCLRPESFTCAVERTAHCRPAHGGVRSLRSRCRRGERLRNCSGSRW